MQEIYRYRIQGRVLGRRSECEKSEGEESGKGLLLGCTLGYSLSLSRSLSLSLTHAHTRSLSLSLSLSRSRSLARSLLSGSATFIPLSLPIGFRGHDPLHLARHPRPCASFSVVLPFFLSSALAPLLPLTTPIGHPFRPLSLLSPLSLSPLSSLHSHLSSPLPSHLSSILSHLSSPLSSLLSPLSTTPLTVSSPLRAAAHAPPSTAMRRGNVRPAEQWVSYRLPFPLFRLSFSHPRL
jgi:hypothetical protein